MDKFTEPLHREIWSDLIQFSQALPCLFQLPRSSVSRDQIYMAIPVCVVHIDRPPAFLDGFLIFVQVQVCMAEVVTPIGSSRIFWAEAECQLKRREGFACPPGEDECTSFLTVGDRKIWIDFKRSVVFGQRRLRVPKSKSVALDHMSHRACRASRKSSVDEVGRYLLVFGHGRRPPEEHING